MGVSWGLLAGADVTDFVIILNTMDAVKAFSGVGNVQVSLSLSLRFKGLFLCTVVIFFHMEWCIR